MHIFQSYVRVSCGAIYVMNYMVKVNIIKEIDLELVIRLYHYSCHNVLVERVRREWELDSRQD